MSQTSERFMNIFTVDNARTVPGYYEGLRAGSDWASTVRANDVVNGFPAYENVQQSGFPSDEYAAGYWRGVWATWCEDHATLDCLGTYACRKAVIARAAEPQ